MQYVCITVVLVAFDKTYIRHTHSLTVCYDKP